eukprot:GHRQ01014452.1.p1 GENE.GHRQ01014452.1~~GHRQ01014452.1.p1  ORF type:complete len:168 (-),score=13.87 GHRQ01014452.1:766-1269(-)
MAGVLGIATAAVLAYLDPLLWVCHHQVTIKEGCGVFSQRLHHRCPYGQVGYKVTILHSTTAMCDQPHNRCSGTHQQAAGRLLRSLQHQLLAITPQPHPDCAHVHCNTGNVRFATGCVQLSLLWHLSRLLSSTDPPSRRCAASLHQALLCVCIRQLGWRSLLKVWRVI